MKIYDQTVSKNISVFNAALFSVIFYLILGVILNIIQSLIDPTGESYNTIFGITQFIIATMYWVLINFIFFSRPGRSGTGAIITYLLANTLPIAIFTAATAVIVMYYPTSDFTLSWNLLTFVVAPTLFWYLPFSYVYFAFGYYITIPLFMVIILLYITCIQVVGIILGLARRAHVLEKENAIKRARERMRQGQVRPQVSFETVQNETTTPMPTVPTIIQTDKLYTGTNPFDEVEASQIINTESFDTITKTMLENASELPDETDVLNQEIDLNSHQEN